MGRLEELKQIDKTHRLLQKPRPQELIDYEEATQYIGFWESKFWELWLMAQSWSGPGKITLENLRICCSDLRLPFDRRTRKVIMRIENAYRSVTNV